jgi:NADH-quinone oxidoreductase subunit C
MAETGTQLQYIQEKLGPRVLDALLFRDDDILMLDRAGLRESFRFFKEDSKLGLGFLADITAVDYWQKKEPRFEVVYQIAALKGGRRLRVRVPVPEEDATVDSLTPLWKGANFLEREVWDLFGIRFIDHPDLRRILLYEEFQGHPLRKDYPVNLWQPRVPERPVDGTFVDERSRTKLLLLKRTLGHQT